MPINSFSNFSFYIFCKNTFPHSIPHVNLSIKRIYFGTYLYWKSKSNVEYSVFNYITYTGHPFIQKFKLWKVLYNHHFIVVHQIAFFSPLYQQLQNTNSPHIHYFNLFFRSFHPTSLQQTPPIYTSTFFLFLIFKLQKKNTFTTWNSMPVYIFGTVLRPCHRCSCLHIDRGFALHPYSSVCEQKINIALLFTISLISFYTFMHGA